MLIVLLYDASVQRNLVCRNWLFPTMEWMWFLHAWIFILVANGPSMTSKLTTSFYFIANFILLFGFLCFLSESKMNVRQLSILMRVCKNPFSLDNNNMIISFYSFALEHGWVFTHQWSAGSMHAPVPLPTVLSSVNLLSLKPNILMRRYT